MELHPGVFEGADDRFKKYEKLFQAQECLGQAVNDFLHEYRELLKVKGGDEHDLSLLIPAALGKGLKTFQAVNRLCLLGYGEDSMILLRSNVNLLINIAFILSRGNPIESAKDYLAFSYDERVKYLKVAHGIDDPPWKPNMTAEEHDSRAKSWREVRIAD